MNDRFLNWVRHRICNWLPVNSDDIVTPEPEETGCEDYSPHPDYISGYFAAWHVFEDGYTKVEDYLNTTEQFKAGWKKAHEDIDKKIGLRHAP